MGLEWAFENQEIIHLKKTKMIFEVGDLKVTAPLDPAEGKRYIENVKWNEIDDLYNTIVRMDDYINLTVDGTLNWRSISSCASYS
jgi:hypothetical protein